MNVLRPQTRCLAKSAETLYKQCKVCVHESRRTKSAQYTTSFVASHDSSACIRPSFFPTRRSDHTQIPCLPVPARFLSTTTPQSATHVLQNPRKDDDGNDMTIEISTRAANRLQQITANPTTSSPFSSSPTNQEPESSHLRVTVTSGGCHGFQYLMSLEPSSKISSDDDTVFTADGSPAAQVVLDESSLELLKGSTIDYTTELIGSQFKIVGNPRAKSSCGCGTSFDVE